MAVMMVIDYLMLITVDKLTNDPKDQSISDKIHL